VRLRCAVLDDYQGAATASADWSVLGDRVEVVALREHLAGEDALAGALADYDIVVTLRERVPFPGSLIARLPRLKLLVASGMRNSVIDYTAAEAHGVTVCGTASSSAPICTGAGSVCSDSGRSAAGWRGSGSPSACG